MILYKQGAIFICRVPEDEPIPAEIMQNFTHTEFQTVHEYDWAVLDWMTKFVTFKKMSPVRVLVGFLPPEDSRSSKNEQT